MRGDSFRLFCTAAAVACAFGAITGQAFAQQRMRPGEMTSRPVIQPLPNRDNLQLNAALSRLGRDPRDLEALIDAGNAALKMGDVEAASGFFRRANQVNARDARVKTGLGGALVRNGDPIGAITLFNEAELAGAQVGALAADRGLAYDLVGDNGTAQRLYRLALERGSDDEVSRRLALSLAISGDRKGTEAALLPLLRQQDKAAWRTRTFALAILSQTDEAIRTAKTILPPDLAESMTPYLRYMPQLTKAQQAAAANLGAFPRAAEIGRDDPRFAQYAAAPVRTASAAPAGVGLVPKGEPLGRGSRARDRQTAQAAATTRKPSKAAVRAAAAAARVAPQVPQPSREATVEPGTATALARAPAAGKSGRATVAAKPSVPQLAAIASGAKPTDVPVAPALPSMSGELPPLTAARPAPTPVPAQTPVPAAVRPTLTVAPAAAPAIAATPRPAAALVARPGFDLSQLPPSQAGAPTPAPAPPVAVAVVPARAPTPAPAPVPARPPVRVSLHEAFRDIGTPSTAAAPTEGAVDITRFTAARPKPAPVKVAAKPAPPSHPSRIWVQLGIGRDKGALSADWKRLTGKAAALLKSRKAYVSEMGQTNRMLTGPFDSASQANKFIADLRGAGVPGTYIWTSPAGQVVDTLTSR